MSFYGVGKLTPGGMNITQIIEDGADCYPWRQVFALWPVKTITGKRIWWDKVYKRKVWVVWGSGFHMEPHVQYATLFEMLTNQDTVLGKNVIA